MGNFWGYISKNSGSGDDYISNGRNYKDLDK